MSLGCLLLFVLSRGALGRARAAAILWTVFLLLILGLGESDLGVADQLAVAVVVATGFTVLAVRSGLLALVVCTTVMYVVPVTVFSGPYPLQWYAAGSVMFMAAVLALTAFGVRTSTADAPLVAPADRGR